MVVVAGYESGTNGRRNTNSLQNGGWYVPADGEGGGGVGGGGGGLIWNLKAGRLLSAVSNDVRHLFLHFVHASCFSIGHCI